MGLNGALQLNEGLTVAVLFAEERLVDTMWTVCQKNFAWKTTLRVSLMSVCEGSAKPDGSKPKAGVRRFIRLVERWSDGLA